VASVEVPPFMAIHYINAYEERGEDDGPAAAVIVDCCEHYGDPAIIETLALHRLRSFRDQDVLPDARYHTMYMHMVVALWQPMHQLLLSSRVTVS